MRIFRSLEEVPADFGPTIVSVGNFDGVHCGHRHVLHEVVRRARANGSKAVAVTFEPHPFRILRPDVAPRLITPLAKKEALLAQTGLDALLEVPFTRDFSMTTAHDFARNILAGKLRAKEVHEGDNFRFGHNAEGIRLATAKMRPGVNSNLLADEGLLDALSGNAVLNGIPVDVSVAS